jgi:hypothetical protein
MAKVVILGSDLVYYNANTRGKSVGDCVKRGLSLAYRMDYDEVASELNKIKRDVGGYAYNEHDVYFKFIQRRGDKITTPPGGVISTVEEFANAHPNGTWLVITSPTEDRAKRGRTNNILPIINGTIYDSWDSSKQFVALCVDVRGGAGSDLHDDVDVTELATFVDKKLDDYKLQLIDKYSDINLQISDSYTAKYDKFTYYHSYKFLYVDNSGRSVWKICKTIIKINPAADFDKNAEVNYKRAKQKMYDTAYELNRHVQASKIQVNERFYGDRKLLLSLPEAIRPYVTSADTYYDSYEQKNKYEFAIKPIPGDDNTWKYYVETWSLRDAKDAINQYLKDFTRTEF